jgi:hypothetical protein
MDAKSQIALLAGAATVALLYFLGREGIFSVKPPPPKPFDLGVNLNDPFAGATLPPGFAPF